MTEGWERPGRLADRHLRPSRRRWLGAVAGAAGSLVLAASAGCARPVPVPGGPQGGGPSATGTVDFLTNQAPEPFAAVQTALAAFQQQHPQVQVHVTNVNGPYQDRLQTLIAAGTPPDLFRVGGDLFANFYILHCMAALDALMGRDKLDRSDFYPASLEQYQWGGKQFGMPSDYGYRMIYYNVDAFQNAGLSLPPGEWNAPGWTFDDFNAAARNLTVRDPATSATRWGFLNPKASWQVWVYANGGRAIGPTNDETWINRPEAVEALQHCQDLHAKWLVGLSDDEAKRLPEAQAFTSGRGVMWQGSTATGTTTARTISGFAWDVTPPPRGPKASGTRKTFGGGSGWFLAAASKSLDAAWLVFQHLLSKDTVSAMAATGFAPIRKSVVSSPVWLDPAKPPKSKHVDTDGFEGIVPFPKLTTWNDWQTAANKELDGLWSGSRSATDVASAIKAVTEPFITRHRELVGKDTP